MLDKMPEPRVRPLLPALPPARAPPASRGPVSPVLRPAPRDAMEMVRHICAPVEKILADGLVAALAPAVGERRRRVVGDDVLPAVSMKRRKVQEDVPLPKLSRPPRPDSAPQSALSPPRRRKQEESPEKVKPRRPRASAPAANKAAARMFGSGASLAPDSSDDETPPLARLSNSAKERRLKKEQPTAAKKSSAKKERDLEREADVKSELERKREAQLARREAAVAKKEAAAAKKEAEAKKEAAAAKKEAAAARREAAEAAVLAKKEAAALVKKQAAAAKREAADKKEAQLIKREEIAAKREAAAKKEAADAKKEAADAKKEAADAKKAATASVKKEAAAAAKKEATAAAKKEAAVAAKKEAAAAAKKDAVTQRKKKSDFTPLPDSTPPPLKSQKSTATSSPSEKRRFSKTSDADSRRRPGSSKVNKHPTVAAPSSEPVTYSIPRRRPSTSPELNGAGAGASARAEDAMSYAIPRVPRVSASPEGGSSGGAERHSTRKPPTPSQRPPTPSVKDGDWVSKERDSTAVRTGGGGSGVDSFDRDRNSRERSTARGLKRERGDREPHHDRSVVDSFDDGHRGQDRYESRDRSSLRLHREGSHREQEMRERYVSPRGDRYESPRDRYSGHWDRDRDRDRDWGRERERNSRGEDRDRGDWDRDGHRDKTGGYRDRRDRDRDADVRRSNGDRERERDGLRDGGGRGSIGHSPQQDTRHGVRGGASAGTPPKASSSSLPQAAAGTAPSPNPVSSPQQAVVRPAAHVLSPTEMTSLQSKLLSSFLDLKARCVDLFAKKQYDEYEEIARAAMAKGFEWALARETELRATETELKRLTPQERLVKKKEIISLYRYLSRSFATKRISELEGIGRKKGTLFFRRGVSKAYLRMFWLQRLWEREQRSQEAELVSLLRSAHEARQRGGDSNTRTGEEEISTSKLGLLQRMMSDYSNVMSIVEGVVTDMGGGHEEAGAECYIQ